MRISPLTLALGLVVPPLATAACLALLGAGAGQLSPELAWAGAAAAFAVASFVAWRARACWEVTVWDVLALAAIAWAMSRAAPATTPWPTFLDSTWYVNTGARIADTGRLAFDTPAWPADAAARRAVTTTFADMRAAGVPGMPDDASRGFFDVAFVVPDLASPTVVPYHPPFFASFVALVVRARGRLRAGEAVLPWALAYLLAVAALARAAFGPPAGALAALLVGASPALVYYGRVPFAEMCAGALATAGLVALVHLPDERPAPWLAAAAGAALGLSVIAKADLLVVVPAAVVGWLWSRRRTGGAREAAGLAAGLAPPAVLAVVLAATISRPYVELNLGGVLALAGGAGTWLAAGLAALGIAALAWRRRLAAHPIAPRRSASASAASGRGASTSVPPGRVASSRPSGRIDAGGAARVVGAVLVVAVAAGVVLGWRTPEGVPPNLVAVLAWLMTPLGLWAAAIGAVRALETREPRHVPVLAVALLAVPLVIALPAVTETMSTMYTVRRLVPYVLPVAAALAAGAGALALAGLRERRPVALAAVAGAGLVLAGLIGASGPLARLRELGGAATAAERLASFGGQDDIYLFATVLDGDYAGRMAAALWNLEGRATAVVGAPGTDPDALAAAVGEWRAAGRRVMLVADDADRLPEVPGYTGEYVGETAVMPTVLAPSPGLPPRVTDTPLELVFVVYEAVPEP